MPQDAVQKLERRLNKGKSSVNNPEYIQLWEPHYARHETEFDLMCDMKKHIELHTTGRVESHVVELTLATPYMSLLDLEIIDKLIKVNMENLEQVSSIKSTIPADNAWDLRNTNGSILSPRNPGLHVLIQEILHIQFQRMYSISKHQMESTLAIDG